MARGRRERALSSLPASPDARLAGSHTFSFEEFYAAEHAGQVHRAALLLNSEADAHEVVHDCFVRLYQRWETLDRPGPYLNQAVLNACRDRGRSRASFKRALPKLVDRDQSAPRDHMADALAALPFNHRAAIVLRFYGSLTTEEIAQELGCSTGSVGPWITRGLASMKRALA